MRFRAYDNLRLFDVVARHMSFTAASHELHLSKGAVSYQINQLEQSLGFDLFIRAHRGISLTEKGKILWHASQKAFHDLERLIADLREEGAGRITIGMSTYFAARWLSPRLMHFMVQHPDISLRLQPMVDLSDFQAENIDMAIRWGKGDWCDMPCERLFHCAAKPMVGTQIAQQIEREGLELALMHIPLLQDKDDSEAWQDWHKAAKMDYRAIHDGLVIQDPNVRLQAVIDGQGAALYDALAEVELVAGKLKQISTVELDAYGYYLIYPEGCFHNPALKAFRDWVIQEAASYSSNGNL